MSYVQCKHTNFKHHMITATRVIKKKNQECETLVVTERVEEVPSSAATLKVDTVNFQQLV